MEFRDWLVLFLVPVGVLGMVGVYFLGLRGKKLKVSPQESDEALSEVRQELDAARQQVGQIAHYMQANLLITLHVANEIRLTDAKEITNPRLAAWRSSLMSEAMSALFMIQRMPHLPDEDDTSFMQAWKKLAESRAIRKTAQWFLRLDQADFRRKDLTHEQLNALVDWVHKDPPITLKDDSSER